VHAAVWRKGVGAWQHHVLCKRSGAPRPLRGVPADGLVVAARRGVNRVARNTQNNHRELTRSSSEMKLAGATAAKPVAGERRRALWREYMHAHLIAEERRLNHELVLHRGCEPSDRRGSGLTPERGGSRCELPPCDRRRRRPTAARRQRRWDAAATRDATQQRRYGPVTHCHPCAPCPCPSGWPAAMLVDGSAPVLRSGCTSGGMRTMETSSTLGQSSGRDATPASTHHLSHKTTRQ
jgi:hypothetical protein